MSNLDDLYNQFQRANEDRKRNNFNVFMTSLYAGLEEDLNKAYGTEKYDELLNRIKSKGFKVMRNYMGKHKVEAR